MIHRHLRPGAEHTATAIEDVLENGSVEDWRELARTVRADPQGPAARSLRLVLQCRHIYGTTRLWQDWLERLDQPASRDTAGPLRPAPPTPRPMLSPAEPEAPGHPGTPAAQRTSTSGEAPP